MSNQILAQESEPDLKWDDFCILCDTVLPKPDPTGPAYQTLHCQKKGCPFKFPSEVFKCDYCPLCGAILIKPKGPWDKYVYCARDECEYRLPASELIGKITYYERILIPKQKKFGKKVTADDFSKRKGPTMEINCVNCGRTEASYIVRQTRSADEGQTIFYTCLTCGKETKED